MAVMVWLSITAKIQVLFLTLKFHFQQPSFIIQHTSFIFNILVLFSPFNIYFQHSSFDLNFTLGWVGYAIQIIPWFHDIFARKQYWNAVIGTRYPNAVIWLVQDTYLKAAIWLLWDAYPYVAIWLVLNTYTYEAIWLMQDTSPNAANWLVQAKYHSTH